jgi:hypothetical protein
MLQVQVVDVVDLDADPLTFQFDWRVNGQTVRLHSSSTASDVLDLSQPGLGDRGDLIELIVTASDGTASTSAMASLTVAASPSELDADYQLAVSQANQVYLANVADRDAAILAARASAQADADELYANYESAVASAQAVYDAAIASAESDYRAALAAANALWELATADVRANYDAAMEAAQAAYDAAIVWLDADYEDAIAAADADYEAYIAPYQSARNAAYDAWQADPQNSQLQQEYNDAQAALDAAIVFASAQRAADYAAALATRQAGAQEANDDLIAALEAANAIYASAIEEANADWNAAEETAWSIYLAAKEHADRDLTDAEASAWDDYVSGVAAIETALASTEASIESMHATPVASAVSAWQTAEAVAWGTYAANLATYHPTAALAARIQSAPLLAAFIGCEERPRIPGLVTKQQPRGPLIDWRNAQATNVLLNTQFGRLRRYTVDIRGGGNIFVYRPVNPNNPPGANDYNCHAYTFGGWDAPGGPFIIDNPDVPTLLQRGYNQIQEANARTGDIVVWYNGNETIHSAVLNNVVIVNGRLSPMQTTLSTKNGRLPFENAMTLQVLCDGPLFAGQNPASGYGGNFRVYRAQ